MDRKDTKLRKLVLLVSMVSFVSSPSGFAQQNDRARTEALARQAGDRLQALQREADRLASEERTLLGDLRKLATYHTVLLLNLR